MKNRNFEQFKADNAKEDAKAPPKKVRVEVVTMMLAFKDNESSKLPSGIPIKTDYSTAPLK